MWQYINSALNRLQGLCVCLCVCDHVLVYGCVQVLCVHAHTCAGLLLGGFLLVQVGCLLLDIIVGVLRHPEHTTQQPVHTLQYTYCTVYDVHITYVHTHIYIPYGAVLHRCDNSQLQSGRKAWCWWR